MTQVAILGFGTVGSGVAEVIEQNAAHIADRSGAELHVKYILDVRDFPDSLFADRMVKDFAVIESDPDVDIVVETIGGARIAYEFTRRALSAGKSVVTSNKELVATHGTELMSLAKAHNSSYLFEASVGGGIPILHPLNICLTANRIKEITGILNGTTNYILTRMIHAGISFDDALKEAQVNGYAERDPSADVDGIDACRKICILSALAGGKRIDPAHIPTEGIRKITLNDVHNAARAAYKIKLLGRAVFGEDGTLSAYVAPHLVSEDNPLSSVDDVFNAIMPIGDMVGPVMFYGQGAGKLATASAVVSDVIEVAKSLGCGTIISWEDAGPEMIRPSESLRFRWYVRAVNSVIPSDVQVLSSGSEQLSFLTTDAYTPDELAAELSAVGVEPEYCIRVLGDL